MHKETIKFSTEVPLSLLVVKHNPCEKRKEYDYARLKDAGFLIENIVGSTDKGLVGDVFVTEFVIGAAVA